MVKHILKTGLKHNKYYKVYVTQVNTFGNESPKSDPALIRVGDVTAPPVPNLRLDTSEFANGCCGNNGFIDVYLVWDRVECDDLANYVLYTWTKGDVFTPETARTSVVIENGATKFTLEHQPNDTYIHIGLCAVDYSNNRSELSIIKVLAEDVSVLGKPTSPCHAEPYGIWAIKVRTECPAKSNIRSVIFFRDGLAEYEIASVDFHSKLVAQHIDVLDVLPGLIHCYTYCYEDMNGRRSPMSDPSETVSAKPIDTEYIDKVALEELRKAWNSENVENIELLKEDLLKQAEQTKALAGQLSSVTEDYNALYNNYTIAANEIKLLSAKVNEQDEMLTAQQTSIEQNAEAITLRATKTDIDNATNQVKAATVAMLDVQSDRIATVVANVNNANSSITQLANQMQLKVNKNDLKGEINLAIQDGLSVAYIEADRIVLNGQLLINNNARVVGKLYANQLALVNADGSIAWGSGMDLRPAVTDLQFPNIVGFRGASSMVDWRVQKLHSFLYTPKPNVSFNGTCNVRITISMQVGMAIQGDRNIIPTLGSNYAWMSLSDSSEGEFSNGYQYQKWSTGEHPAIDTQLRNFNYVGYQDYFNNEVRNFHSFQKDITLQYNRVVPIGQQIAINLWGRLWNTPTAGSGTIASGGNGNSWMWYGYMKVHIECT